MKATHEEIAPEQCSITCPSLGFLLEVPSPGTSSEVRAIASKGQETNRVTHFQVNTNGICRHCFC